MGNNNNNKARGGAGVVQGINFNTVVEFEVNLNDGSKPKKYRQTKQGDTVIKTEEIKEVEVLQ